VCALATEPIRFAVSYKQRGDTRVSTHRDHFIKVLADAAFNTLKNNHAASSDTNDGSGVVVDLKNPEVR